MTSQKLFFFAFQHFEYHISVEHDVKPPQPKFAGKRLAMVESALDITAHEYPNSPIEISVNWPGSLLLGTRPIYSDFYEAIHAGISRAPMNRFM